MISGLGIQVTEQAPDSEKPTDKQMYIGIAEEDGAEDDIGSLIIAPGIFVA